MRASCLNFVLFGLVKPALGNEPVDDVRLAQRNDAVALLPRGDPAAGFDGRVHHEPPAGARTAFPAKPDPELECDPHLHRPR